MAKFDNGQDFILDPMGYLGRVKERDAQGRPRLMEIIYDDDLVKLSEKPEENTFFTFTTQVLLEES